MLIKNKYNSPNHYNGRRGWKPDMIVCHVTAGDTYMSTYWWFMNPKAQTGSHFVVDKNGDIYQFNKLTDGAWCNGTSVNSKDKCFYGKATNHFVRERKTNANYYTYSIEFVDKDGAGITPQQIDSGIELIKYIREENKRLYGVDIPLDRQHIIGHCEINPITKPLCPGKMFPWDKIMKGLNCENQQKTTKKGVSYKVQVGSFGVRANAESLARELNKKGYKTYIVTEVE